MASWPWCLLSRELPGLTNAGSQFRMTLLEQVLKLFKVFATLALGNLFGHPFSDGNSRTLRTFTKQLANEAGYELDWERFGRSAAGRDLLYIARDRSVNELAKPHIQHEQSMRKIIHSVDRLEGNRDLPNLLRDAVRPSRAVAFERMQEAEALQEYPDLKAAFKTLHAASTYFESKMPGKPDAQQAAMKSVVGHVQTLLNEGETHDFSASRDATKKERQTASVEEIKTIEDLRQQAKRELAAEVFKQKPAAEAMKTHPELAGAYEAMAAVDKKAEADGLTEQQRAVIEARVRQNAANSIERGDIPEGRIKEEIEVKQEKPLDR